MVDKLKITILVENTTYINGLLAEHGLSYYIEIDGKRYLFDTGQTGIVTKNAQKLGAELKSLDGIILSHGHYDHTGGLKSVLGTIKNNSGKRIDIYAHPDIFINRYSYHPGKPLRTISFPFSRESLEELGANFVLSRTRVSVDGINITGEIPRITDFERVPDSFFKDRDLTVHDNLDDDLSIFIETKKGIVVLLGCCHSGIVNTLSYISSITGNKTIYWVIGGTHLMDSSRNTVEKTVSELTRFNLRHISPLHCTGTMTKNIFINSFKNEFYDLSTGSSISI